MVWDVYDRPLIAFVPATIEQCGLYEPRRLVMKQAVPPLGRDKFGQNDCGELAVVVLAVGFVEEIQQGTNR